MRLNTLHNFIFTRGLFQEDEGFIEKGSFSRFQAGVGECV